jgi:hypothetical protein
VQHSKSILAETHFCPLAGQALTFFKSKKSKQKTIVARDNLLKIFE